MCTHCVLTTISWQQHPFKPKSLQLQEVQRLQLGLLNDKTTVFPNDYATDLQLNGVDLVKQAGSISIIGSVTDKN